MNSDEFGSNYMLSRNNQNGRPKTSQIRKAQTRAQSPINIISNEIDSYMNKLN